MAEAPTPPDLVGLARRMGEAANRRDVDAILRFFAPDAVADMSDLGVGIFEGAAAIRATMEDWWNLYEEYAFAAHEITRIGGTVVLTINTQTARLVGSSSHLREISAFVLQFEDTLVIRWMVYGDIDEARAAAERLAHERARLDLAVFVQRIAEAVRARDFDAALAFFTPNAVFDVSDVGLGVFEGRSAIRGLWQDWTDAYEDYEFMLEEHRDFGADVTLAVFAQRGRPAGSTGWVHFRYAGVYTWQDGLIERVTNYTDIDQARAAAERLAEERR